MDDEEAVKESEKKWTKPTMDKEREKKQYHTSKGASFLATQERMLPEPKIGGMDPLQGL